MKKSIGAGIILVGISAFLLVWLLLPICQHELIAWSGNKVFATFVDTYLWIPLILSIITVLAGVFLIKCKN